MQAEAVFQTFVHQDFRRAGCPVAEAVIETAICLFDVKAVHEDLFHELLGRHEKDLLRERNIDQIIDPHLFDDARLFLRVKNVLNRIAVPQDRARMIRESEDRALKIHGLRGANRTLDDLLVAFVDPVEIAERHDGLFYIFDVFQ